MAKVVSHNIISTQNPLYKLFRLIFTIIFVIYVIVDILNILSDFEVDVSNVFEHYHL